MSDVQTLSLCEWSSSVKWYDTVKVTPCRDAAQKRFTFYGITMHVCGEHATDLRAELNKKGVKWEYSGIIEGVDNGEHGAQPTD